MRRILALVVVVFFAASVTVAFAEAEKKERNLIKIIQSTIKPGTVKEKNKLKNPLQKVTVFQSTADDIKKCASTDKAKDTK